MSQILLAAAAIVLLAFSLPAHVVAQDTGVDQQTDAALPRHGCFRGRPLPECQGFWLWELRGSVPAVSTTRTLRNEYPDTAAYFGPPEYSLREYDRAVGVDFGYVRNLNETYALGGTLGAEHGHRTRYLARARVRRWIGTGGVSLELLPGVLRDPGDYFIVEPSLGYTMAARVNILDQGFLGIRYDAFNIPERTWDFGVESRYDPGGTQHAIHAVAGLGSVPALWGAGALGLGYVILLGAFLAADT